jgi:TRAP-type C4-dicarboxylate transport system permease small subunit
MSAVDDTAAEVQNRCRHVGVRTFTRAVGRTTVKTIRIATQLCM